MPQSDTKQLDQLYWKTLENIVARCYTYIDKMTYMSFAKIIEEFTTKMPQLIELGAKKFVYLTDLENIKNDILDTFEATERFAKLQKIIDQIEGQLADYYYHDDKIAEYSQKYPWYCPAHHNH